MLAFISNCIYLLLVYIQTFVFCKLTLHLAIFLKITTLLQEFVADGISLWLPHRQSSRSYHVRLI